MIAWIEGPATNEVIQPSTAPAKKKKKKSKK
jgi:hypothetical protein